MYKRQNERTSIIVLEEILEGLNNEMASKSFEDGDEEEATARLVQLNQDIEDEKEKKVELKKKQSI